MRQLLKIYGPEFAKNAFYLFLILWPLSFLIYHITHQADHYVKIHLILFTFFNFILFMFSYPLTRGLKWIIYLPVNKNKVIIFNIIFQIYKVLLIFFLLILTQVILTFLSYSDIKEGIDLLPASSAPKYLKYISINNNLKNELSIIKESTTVFGTILALTFFFSIMFSVSPQLLIENRYSIAPKLKDYLYYVKKYKYFFIMIIPLWFCLKNTYSYWSAPIFIMSLSMGYIIFAFFYSYFSRLLYSRKSFYYLFFIAFSCATVFFSISFQYAHEKIKKNHDAKTSILSEVFFLKGFSPYIENEKLKSFLEESITDHDIIDIMEIVEKKKIKKRFFHSNQGNFTKINHSYQNLNFKKIIGSKKTLDALEVALGLFEIKKLTVDEVLYFLEKWSELSEKNKIGFKTYLIDIFSDLDLDLHDHSQLLQSKNYIIQVFSLKIMQAKKNPSLNQHIIKYRHHFADETLFYTSKILGETLCKKIKIKEILEKDQLPENDCAKIKLNQVMNK